MISRQSAIGIDLGSEFSCVAFWRKGHAEVLPNEFGSRTTPSYVAFTETGKLFGEEALNQANRNVANTAWGWKRMLGLRFSELSPEDRKTWPFTIDRDEDDRSVVVVAEQRRTRRLHPEELSAMLLKRLQESAEKIVGVPLKNVVISIPVWYDQVQCDAIRNAAKIAGLTVLRLISSLDAMAILIAFNQRNNKREHNKLLIDFGASGFQVAVATFDEGTVDMKAMAGSPVGGYDLTLKLVEWCQKDIQTRHETTLTNNPKAYRRLWVQCDKAKRSLSAAQQTTVDIEGLFGSVDYEATITRKQFEELCAPLFEHLTATLKRPVKESGLSNAQIEEIVVVGCSARIPRLTEILAETFPGVRINKSLNFDETVAQGTAIQAAILSKGSGNDEVLQQLLLIEALSHSIGVQAEGGGMTLLVRRNDTIPTKHTLQAFTYHLGGKTELQLRLYEGEKATANANRLIGTMQLRGLTNDQKGNVALEFSFVVFEGKQELTLTVVEQSTKQKWELRVNCSLLDEDEIVRAKQALNGGKQAEVTRRKTQMPVEPEVSNLTEAKSYIEQLKKRLATQQKESFRMREKLEKEREESDTRITAMRTVLQQLEKQVRK